MSLGPYIGVHYPVDNISPDANRHNRDSFVGRWMRAYGGDARNAVNVWHGAVRANESRDLLKPYTPPNEPTT